MLFPRGLILITPKKLEGPGEELNFEQKLMVFRSPFKGHFWSSNSIP